MENNQASDSGFVDVAANSVAVLILVTMIALLIAMTPSQRGEVQGNERPEFFFPTALDPTRPPLNTYWVAIENGVGEIDLQAIAKSVRKGDMNGKIAAGEFFFQNDRLQYRDLDEYRLDLTIQVDRLKSNLSEYIFEMEQFIEDRESDFLNNRSVASIMVTPEGFEMFSVLAAQLRKKDIPFRWRFTEDRQTMKLLRKMDMFETGMRTWR